MVEGGRMIAREPEKSPNLSRRYSIRYDKKFGLEWKVKKALDDCLKYLGPREYRKVARSASAVCSFKGFSMGCSAFLGIEGWPVEALWRRYNNGFFIRPERDWPEDRAAVMEERYMC